MINILHMSDLHFGEVFLPHIGEALVFSAHELQTDLIAVSGDFTQNATEQQFQRARDFLKELPQCPIIVTPGNHDVPPRFSFRDLCQPFALYRRYIHPKLDYVSEYEGIKMVSLNSTSSLGSLVNGRLSRQQLEFCTQAFQNTPKEMLRVMMCHHHLAPAPKLNGGGVMWHAKRTIDQLQDAHVDLVLGGHKHRSYVGNSLDFYTGEIREHGIILVQCGTSTSRRGRGREREKNTFNWIHVEPHEIHVIQYMYFKEVNGFEIIGKHIFPRAGNRFVKEDTSLQTVKDVKSVEVREGLVKYL